MDYKIDKNIPPPPRDKYPFATMEPGDSFPFPLEELKRVKKAGYNFSRKHKKFRFYAATEQDGAGVAVGARCWRAELPSKNGRVEKKVPSAEPAVPRYTPAPVKGE